MANSTGSEAGQTQMNPGARPPQAHPVRLRMCAQPATAAVRLMAAPARTAAAPAELSEGLAGPNFPPSPQQRRHFGANRCPACSPDQPFL
jgi:hypothetical protein